MGNETPRLFDITTPPDLAGAAYENRVREQARVLKSELIRQTLEDSASWARSVEDKWANDHPDLAPIFPVTDQEIAEYRERVQNSDYEWIIPAFEQFITPDPDQFTPIIAALGKIEASFDGTLDGEGNWTGPNTNLLRIHDVRTDMDEWAGAFKNSFIDRFLTPFQGTLLKHAELALIAGDQMRLTKVCYIRQRKSVLELLDQAINATRALSNGACSPGDVLKWATIMMVATGTVVGAYATGVGIVAGAVCLEVAGTIGQGLLPQPEEKQKLPLTAPTASEVAMNVSQAISRLANDLHNMEQVAANALRELHWAVEKERIRAATSNLPGTFTVPAPPLANATPAQTDQSFFPDE
ncbi:hypothetical protein AB0G04_04930 [Actinoplanes sp. NPDC023801]|uniref:hypothetical protein n=1 Tax=Actinoplanes sp. NPDC023801 TaxID=3154595 RepID=UPI0033F7EE22